MGDFPNRLFPIPFGSSNSLGKNSHTLHRLLIHLPHNSTNTPTTQLLVIICHRDQFVYFSKPAFQEIYFLCKMY